MGELPAAGLANTITGFATLFAGLLALTFSALVRSQPARWVFAYWCIAVTGVFTITLHGFGETLAGPGDRHLWSVLDTGSNLVVVWALLVAILGDYYTPTLQRRAGLLAAVLVGVAVWTMWLENPARGPRAYVIPLGAWGGFFIGETVLIGMAWLVGGLLYFRRDMMPARARPLLYLLFATFFSGMLMAIPANTTITYPFFAWHALWHVVGAFGFITLWAFNHARFAPEA